MIQLTEKSANKVKQILSEREVEDKTLLRVGIKAGGCSGFTYTIDFDKSPTKFDQVFESHGVNILCDKKSLLWISGLEIDWSDDLMDHGFKFDNPKAKATCGCKTSFMPDKGFVDDKPVWLR